MTEVASAYVSIMPSAKGFGRSLESDVGGQVNTAGSSIGKKFGTALKVGAVAAVGGALLAGKFLKGALDEAREAQKVGAQTEAVIKSTGSAAGVTAQQVGDLAGALSAKTGIDDEVIQSGQNMLLTFKNIRNEAGAGNDIFNQSTKALVDMSAAMGTEPKQAAIQLGKALNDPVKGISALSRVGIQFTEGQKKVIDSLVEGGKTADAQKIILRELNSQFGGSAEAQATAADKFSVAWGNFKETIGTALLPVVDSLLTSLTDLTVTLTNNVGPAFAKIQSFVAPFVAQFQGLFGGGTGGGLASQIQSGFIPAVTSIGTTLRTNLLPPIMEVVTAFRTAFSTLLPIVQQAVTGMIERIRPFFPQIQQVFQQVVSTAGSALTQLATVVTTLTKVISVVWEKFGDRFLDYLASTLKNVVTVVQGALNIIQGVIRLVTSVIKGDWSGAWDAIKQILRGAWQVIQGVVSQGLNTLKSMLSNLGSVLKALFSKAWDLALSAVKAGITAQINLVKSLPGRIKSALGNVGSLLYNAGRDLIQGFMNGIESMAAAVAQKAKDIANGAVGAVKGALGIKSPSRVFHQIGDWTMQGLVNGLAAGLPAVVKAVTGAGADIQKAFLDRLTTMRDGVKSVLDGLRSDFDSLRTSVAGAFTGDLFGFENLRDFMVNLVGTKSELKSLKKAFKKLLGWGVAPQFLSSLFQSGNGGLILEMAAGDRISALTSASLFGDINALSNSLGGQVARADIGPKIDATNRRLERIERAIDRLPKGFGRELNNAVGHGQQRGSK